MPLTVGTAGHIDHGKTALVEALTGKNTDRLPEERERGISIDLGYAPLQLPDGTSLSVGCSIGLAMFPEDATAYETLLAIADSRMYSQKLQRRVPVTPGP